MIQTPKQQSKIPVKCKEDVVIRCLDCGQTVGIQYLKNESERTLFTRKFEGVSPVRGHVWWNCISCGITTHKVIIHGD